MVRVAQTEDGPATFFHWGHEDAIIGQDTPDPIGQSYYDLYQESVLCGKPATGYVDYGENRVWMCVEHYGVCNP
jgi:hypothetical protein